MKYVRVSVYKGKLTIGAFFEENGMMGDPGLDYQLFDDHGNAVNSEFTGEVAWSTGDDGFTYITPNIRAHEVNVFMYRLDRYPTPESVEYRNGWIHAMKMKRKTWPKNKSQLFTDGFRDAWQEREKYAR